MKKTFMAVVVLDLGFLFAQQDLHSSAAPDAKRNPRFFRAFQAAATTLQGATITGTVVDARTMQPLRGAIVSAACVPSAKADPPTNIGFRTGLDGKFVLRGVAPGIVNFLVVKAGYASGPYASVRPASDGERIDDVILAISPGAAVGGRVVDEAGQPVADAMVTARTTGPIPAALRPPSMVGVVSTDDDGRYWLGGLSAGEYVVSVGGLTDPARIVSMGSKLFGPPGATDPRPPAQAKLLLAAGEERTATDLVIQFGARFTGPVPIDTGSALIAGQVVDGRGAGIPHATVVLRQTQKGGGTQTIRADGAGRFQFPSVPAGTVSLGAAQPGFIAAIAEVARPTTLQVAAGSRTENIVLVAGRGGTISGKLTDEFGDPVAGAVIAMTPRTFNMSGGSVSIFTGADGGARVPGRAASADTRGRYRITGLPPGAYLVSVGIASAMSGRSEVHFDHGGQDRTIAPGTVFYPGVSVVSQASKITVADGHESAGVDLVIRPLLAVSINVTVTTSRPVNEIQLTKILLDDQFPMMEGGTKLTGSSVTSVTLEARTGRYRLLASAEVASSADNVTRLWSSVDVDTDPLLPAAVNMALEPGANISGRIIFEGKESNRQNAGAYLVPMAVLPGISLPTIDGNLTFTVATGEFSIEGVMPGRYVLQAAANAEQPRSLWMLKAATLRGRDVIDEPIDLVAGDEIDGVRLTVTDQISEVSGRVLDAGDRPIRDRWVVIFAADKRYWWPGSRRVRAVRPNPDGRYVARGLPPGSYLVALVSDVTTEYELIAKLPSLVSSGIRVTLAEGEKKEQDLRSVRR